MGLEQKSTNDLVRIAASSAGFKLNAQLKTTEDLVRIAAATSNKGARIIFSGIGLKSTEDLVRIGAAGKGVVFLED